MAIGRADVYFSRAIHAFSAGFKCRHCIVFSLYLSLFPYHGLCLQSSLLLLISFPLLHSYGKLLSVIVSTSIDIVNCHTPRE